MAQEVKIIKVFQFAEYAVVEWEANGHYKYVACWCPYIINPETDLFNEWRKPTFTDEGDTVNAYWGQGHYFSDEKEALEYAMERENEAVDAKIENLRDYLERIKEALV